MARDEEFAAYYASRGVAMRGTAYLLCGDWHLAEDLTQTAFVKLYGAWSRVSRHEALDQYTRQILVRAFLDERRRPWRRERPTTMDHTAFERGESETCEVWRSAAATLAARIAATTLFAAAVLAVSAARAVAPSLWTPKENEARSGTVRTEPVPVTVSPTGGSSAAL